MNFPRHGRKSATRRHRSRKKRYLVVTAGRVTEIAYFRLLREMFNVVIDSEAGTKSPSELAKLAANLYQSDSREQGVDHYCHVWVVVDVDDYPVDNFIQAEKICRKVTRKDSGAQEYPISLIVSKPCFEVWLIDHWQMCPLSITKTGEAEKLAAKLGLVDGSRNKYLTGKITDREQLSARLDAARVNAQKHNHGQRPDLRSGARLTPPWTDMPEVLEQLEKDTRKQLQ